MVSLSNGAGEEYLTEVNSDGNTIVLVVKIDFADILKVDIVGEFCFIRKELKMAFVESIKNKLLVY